MPLGVLKKPPLTENQVIAYLILNSTAPNRNKTTGISTTYLSCFLLPKRPLTP